MATLAALEDDAWEDVEEDELMAAIMAEGAAQHRRLCIQQLQEADETTLCYDDDLIDFLNAQTGRSPAEEDSPSFVMPPLIRPEDRPPLPKAAKAATPPTKKRATRSATAAASKELQNTITKWDKSVRQPPTTDPLATAVPSPAPPRRQTPTKKANAKASSSSNASSQSRANPEAVISELTQEQQRNTQADVTPPRATPQITAANIEDLEIQQRMREISLCESSLPSVIPAIPAHVPSEVTHVTPDLLASLNSNGPGFAVQLSFRYDDFTDFERRVERQQAENLAAIRQAAGDTEIDPTTAHIPSRSRNTAASSSSDARSTTAAAPPPFEMPSVRNLPPVGYAPFTLYMSLYYANMAKFRDAFRHSILDMPFTTNSPEPCTLQHVQRVMAAPYGAFRPCKKDDECFCKMEVAWDFVMMEFLPEKQFDEVLNTGRPPAQSERAFCYICYLALINMHWCVAANAGAPPSTITLPFYHIVDDPQHGYKQEAMIQPITNFNKLDLNKIVSDVPRTGTGDCFGLTLPVRHYCTSQYTMVPNRRVTFKDAETGRVRTEEVPALDEAPELFFLTHNTTFTRLRTVKSFIYLESKLLYRPPTHAILSHLFSPDHERQNCGLCRLDKSKRFNIAGVVTDIFPHITDPTKKYILPRYWSLLELPEEMCDVEFEPFPWQYIFTPNIVKATENIKQLVRGGRIPIAYMLSQQFKDLAVTTNMSIPLAVYEQALNEDIISCRLYYVTHAIRMAVLTTLMAVYPESKHSESDTKIHTRVRICYEWNMAHYNKYLTMTRFDSDVDINELERIAQIPMPYYFYSTDVHYWTIDQKFQRRQTPVEFLAACWPDYIFFFREFSETLGDVDQLFRENLNANAALATYDVYRHYRIHQQVADAISVDTKSSTRVATMTPARYQLLVQELLSRPDYSIYITALYRINFVLVLHEYYLQFVLKYRAMEKKLSAFLLAAAKHPLATMPELHQQYNRARVMRRQVLKLLYQWRERRYMLRLFAFTHLDLIQRMEDLNKFDNASLHQIAPHRNPNYCWTHYKESYPFSTRTPHQGELVDITRILPCVPFPDPHNNNAGLEQHISSSKLLKLIHALYPRPRSHQHTTNMPRHLKLCSKQSSYCRLARNAIELTLIGGYLHADYMPPFETCVATRRRHTTQFEESAFISWQEQNNDVAILAMREFLVFQCRLNSPWNDYLIYNYPYWADYSNLVLRAADFSRKMGQNSSLELVGRAIQIIFNPYADSTILPERFQSYIVREDLFKVIDYTLVRKQIVIHELRTLCRHLSTISKERSRANVPRYPLYPPLKRAIEQRVRAIRPKTQIDLQWLRDFNLKDPDTGQEYNVITNQTITLLKFAFYFILIGEKGEQLAVKALRAISLDEYEVVEAFFFNLNLQYCLNVLHLDEHTTKLQLEAIYRRYQLNTEELRALLTPGVTTLSFTTCCGNVLTYVSTKTEYPSFGGRNMAVNIYTGEVVDTVATVSQLNKQKYRRATLLRSRLAVALNTYDRAGVSNICDRIKNALPDPQRRFHAQAQCGTANVLPVQLLGRVVQVTNTRVTRSSNTPMTTAYTICTSCGSACEFSTRMYGINGLNCGKCDERRTNQLYTPTCVACYQHIKPKDRNFSLYVINDLPGVGTYCLERMYVCQHCVTRKTATYRQDKHKIYTATELSDIKSTKNNGLTFTMLIRSGHDITDYLESTKHQAEERVPPPKKPRYE